MKKFMKQHWKIITGVFFLIGGLANIGDDTEAAIFGIVVGAAFIVWWVLGRKNLQEKISHQTDYQSISSSPAENTLRTVSATEKSTTSLSTPEMQEAPPSQSRAYKFSIEVSGFKEDDDSSQNLDFYRDRLNSKKALTTFDTYVVLDCETTGLSPNTDEIIEIALIKYVKGNLTDTFESLVLPSRPISSRITEITGITNADLADAPKIQDVIPKVWEFIDGFILVGHNIPFDIGFLKKQFVKNGYEGRFNYVDTLQLARSAFPNFPNHKLSTCIEQLSLSDKQTHRALDDVFCTQRLLDKCLPVLLEQKERELAERRARKAALKE